MLVIFTNNRLRNPDRPCGMPSGLGKRNVAELMRGYAPKNILGLTSPSGIPLHENRNMDNQHTSLTERERIVRALIRKQLRDKKYNRGPEITAVLCELANGVSLRINCYF